MNGDWSGCSIVVVPTYNERENLPRLVREIRSLPRDIHVLVVDDNSPDCTGKIADDLAASDDGVHVLHRVEKLGLGTAYRAGFHFALKHGYQFVCTMDADFSHNPRSLPDLLDMATGQANVANGPGNQQFDLVVGSRYVEGGRVVGSNWYRKLISYSANWLAHIMLGTAIHDCTAGFRCYRSQVLETIDLDSIFSSGYSFLIEMAVYCQRARFRMGEVPIIFVNRTEGSSKISKWEIVRAIYTLVRLRTDGLPWNRVVEFVGQYRNKRIELQ